MEFPFFKQADKYSEFLTLLCCWWKKNKVEILKPQWRVEQSVPLVKSTLKTWKCTPVTVVIVRCVKNQRTIERPAKYMGKAIKDKTSSWVLFCCYKISKPV